MVGLGGFLGALVIGGLAGTVAAYLLKSQIGLLWSIVLGVAGAVVANILLPLLGVSGTNGFTLYSFVVSLVGAVVVLGAVNYATRNRLR